MDEEKLLCKLTTLTWMKFVLSSFLYKNDDPTACWEDIMRMLVFASPKFIKEHPGDPFEYIDQTTIRKFSKGYMMALAKYNDTKIANERMREKLISILMKELNIDRETLINDVKIIYAKMDLLINGIHINE